MKIKKTMTLETRILRELRRPIEPPYGDGKPMSVAECDLENYVKVRGGWRTLGEAVSKLIKQGKVRRNADGFIWAVKKRKRKSQHG